MALIATPGAADANSFSTLAEFNAYLTTHVNGAAVASKTDAEKEAALVTSTRTLGSMFVWRGTGATATQALEFPRVGLWTRNGFALASDIIPKEIKDATSELARLLLAGNAESATGSSGTSNLSQLTAGPVTLKFREGAAEILPSSVTLLIPLSWYEQQVDEDAPQTMLFDTMVSETPTITYRRIL
jgi:hypothetical protein